MAGCSLQDEGWQNDAPSGGMIDNPHRPLVHERGAAGDLGFRRGWGVAACKMKGGVEGGEGLKACAVLALVV